MQKRSDTLKLCVIVGPALKIESRNWRTKYDGTKRRVCVKRNINVEKEDLEYACVVQKYKNMNRIWYRRDRGLVLTRSVNGMMERDGTGLK